MFADLREEMIRLTNEDDNQFEDGSIDWNFVEADIYLSGWDERLGEEQLTEWFDMIADEIEGL